MNQSRMEPFYFGAPALFGCYHAAANPAREFGILLCYPMAEEYLRFHRAFRQLAERLAGIGFPVLRFDLYGCGDSAGDSEAGDLSQWLADISTAIAELKRRAEVEQVFLIGLRLGATLAMMAGSNGDVARNDIAGLALVDPIVNGSDFLQELKLLHKEMMKRAHVKAHSSFNDKNSQELLGFPISNRLRKDLAAVNLLSITAKPDSRILLLATNARIDQQPLKRHLTSLNIQLSYQQTPLPQLWQWSEDISRVIMPRQIFQQIADWLEQAVR